MHGQAAGVPPPQAPRSACHVATPLPTLSPIPTGHPAVMVGCSLCPVHKTNDPTKGSTPPEAPHRNTPQQEQQQQHARQHTVKNKPQRRQQSPPSPLVHLRERRPPGRRGAVHVGLELVGVRDAREQPVDRHLVHRVGQQRVLRAGRVTCGARNVVSESALSGMSARSCTIICSC